MKLSDLHPSPCRDCGTDTAPADDRRRRGARPWEWYMVHDSVWADAGMPPMSENEDGDYLCIGCLEIRLGRRLTPHDFADAGVNSIDRWNSSRLNDRLKVMT